MPGLSEFFLGSPQQVQQLSRLGPEQQQALSQIVSQIGPALTGADFEGIASEARRGFQQQTVPTIMERLTALGGDRSSAVGQQLGAAGAGLESQLGALRGQYAQQNLQTLLGAGLQPQMENVVMPEQQGLLQALLVALGGGLGTGLGIGGASGLNSLSSLFRGGF